MSSNQLGITGARIKFGPAGAAGARPGHPGQQQQPRAFAPDLSSSAQQAPSGPAVTAVVGSQQPFLQSPDPMPSAQQVSLPSAGPGAPAGQSQASWFGSLGASALASQSQPVPSSMAHMPTAQRSEAMGAALSAFGQQAGTGVFGPGHLPASSGTQTLPRFAQLSGLAARPAAEQAGSPAPFGQTQQGPQLLAASPGPAPTTPPVQGAPAPVPQAPGALTSSLSPSAPAFTPPGGWGAPPQGTAAASAQAAPVGTGKKAIRFGPQARQQQQPAEPGAAGAAPQMTAFRPAMGNEASEGMNPLRRSPSPQPVPTCCYA